MLKTLSAALIVVTVLLGSHVQANNDYTASQAYFEDPTNSLDLSEVSAKAFTPYTGMLSKGYSSSTYWIKLQIKPSDHVLALRIRPSYAESVELFDPVGPASRRLTGASHPWRDSEIQAYGHHFKIEPNQQERTFFLKMKSSRSYLISLDVMPINEYMRQDHTDYLIYTGYLIFTFMLALGLFGAWVSTRDRILGIFTVQQFIASLHTLLVVGHARIFFDRYIDNQTLNFISYGVLITYPLVGAYANKLLLEDYGLNRGFRILFTGLMFTSLAIILIMSFGYVGIALNINAQLVMVLMLSCTAASLFGINTYKSSSVTTLPLYTLRAYYVFSTLGWMVAILPLLGIIQATEITLHSLFIYNALSGLVFFWLLQYRARLILKNEITKSDSLKKEAQSERVRREEQGKLMAMLTHEIRTPLSVLKLIVDRKVAGSDLEEFANRAVSNIDSIIDKCIQLDQLDLKALQIHPIHFNVMDLLTTIVIDLDAVKRVDIQGPEVLDLHSDVDIVRVIFSNLIGNALKYSPNDSTIQVEIQHATQNDILGVRLSVINFLANGVTVDPERVFDKYYRGASASRISGSGLGLFLVKELSHALRGDVQCSITTNSVTFTAWIPN